VITGAVEPSVVAGTGNISGCNRHPAARWVASSLPWGSAACADRGRLRAAPRDVQLRGLRCL